MLREKRPFQINSLRCTACCNNGESAYSALVRYQCFSPDMRTVMPSYRCRIQVTDYLPHSYLTCLRGVSMTPEF